MNGDNIFELVRSGFANRSVVTIMSECGAPVDPGTSSR